MVDIGRVVSIDYSMTTGLLHEEANKIDMKGMICNICKLHHISTQH